MQLQAEIETDGPEAVARKIERSRCPQRPVGFLRRLMQGYTLHKKEKKNAAADSARSD